MTQRGFSLIEVLIAVAISGFLGVMVFQAIGFFQQSALRYYEIAECVRQQELWSRQLEKDISSMVIPLFGQEQKEEKPKKPGEKAPEPDKKEQESFQKKQQEYAEKFTLECVIDNGASLCKSFSWVTTNALRVYGKQKPFLTRVRYYLQPHAEHTGLYTLYRQELPLIDLRDLEKVSSDPQYAGTAIAFNIQQLQIRFTSIEQKEKELVVKELSVWAPKHEKGPSVKQIPLPQIMQFTGVMQNPATKHEYSYEFHIPLIVASLGKKDEKST